MGSWFEGSPSDYKTGKGRKGKGGARGTAGHASTWLFCSNGENACKLSFVLSFLRVFVCFPATLISPLKLWSPYTNEKPDTLIWDICVSIMRKSPPNLSHKLLAAATTLFHTIFSCKPNHVTLGLHIPLPKKHLPTHTYQPPLDAPTPSWIISTQGPWVILLSHFHPTLCFTIANRKTDRQTDTHTRERTFYLSSQNPLSKINLLIIAGTEV